LVSISFQTQECVARFADGNGTVAGMPVARSTTICPPRFSVDSAATAWLRYGKHRFTPANFSLSGESMTAQPPPPPGYPPQQPAGKAPDNYLVWSILVTLFCCLPLGIVAIIKSTQVNGLWTSGQYAEAQAAAQSARKFCIWGAIIGVVVGIIYAIIAIAGGLSTSSNAAMLAAMF
jgi:predicted secreted protein